MGLAGGAFMVQTEAVIGISFAPGPTGVDKTIFFFRDGVGAGSIDYR